LKERSHARFGCHTNKQATAHKVYVPSDLDLIHNNNTLVGVIPETKKLCWLQKELLDDTPILLSLATLLKQRAS
jgi:hypothetical protein